VAATWTITSCPSLSNYKLPTARELGVCVSVCRVWRSRTCRGQRRAVGQRGGCMVTTGKTSHTGWWDTWYSFAIPFFVAPLVIYSSRISNPLVWFYFHSKYFGEFTLPLIRIYFVRFYIFLKVSLMFYLVFILQPESPFLFVNLSVFLQFQLIFTTPLG